MERAAAWEIGRKLKGKGIFQREMTQLDVDLGVVEWPAGGGDRGHGGAAVLDGQLADRKAGNCGRRSGSRGGSRGAKAGKVPHTFLVLNKVNGGRVDGKPRDSYLMMKEQRQDLNADVERFGPVKPLPLPRMP